MNIPCPDCGNDVRLVAAKDVPQGKVVYHGSEKAYTLGTGYKVARWKE